QYTSSRLNYGETMLKILLAVIPKVDYGIIHQAYRNKELEIIKNMYHSNNAQNLDQDEVNSIEIDEEDLNHNEFDFEDFEDLDENIIGNNNSKGCDFVITDKSPWSSKIVNH
ncbi:5965_t:CDS:2, partial [Entrophospora sp. SA101]